MKRMFNNLLHCFYIPPGVCHDKVTTDLLCGTTWLSSRGRWKKVLYTYVFPYYSMKTHCIMRSRQWMRRNMKMSHLMLTNLPSNWCVQCGSSSSLTKTFEIIGHCQLNKYIHFHILFLELICLNIFVSSPLKAILFG